MLAGGVGLSVRGAASSGGGPAVFAAGASRSGSGHSYAHEVSAFAGDNLAVLGSHVDVSFWSRPGADRCSSSVREQGGVASCGAGVQRLRRQARSRLWEIVGVSSYHVDHFHTRTNT